MRRENRKKDNESNSLYITGGILIASIAAFVIAFVLYANRFGNNIYSLDSEYLAKYEVIPTEDNTTSASSSIGKTVGESQNNIENQTTIKNENTVKTYTNNNEDIVTKKDTISNQKKTTTTKIEQDPVFQSPLEGEITKEFAKDSLLYSETLKEWITHLGIDIKAEKATVVKSAADGTVSAIKNDPRFGLTIIIKHASGFETRYANLLTTEFVSEGEEVKAGQTIGTVGDTAVYEIVDEPHLHFEIVKNGENVNPANYIKF